VHRTWGQGTPPKPDVEELPRPLETKRFEWLSQQRFASGVDEMIEFADLAEEGFDAFLACEVNSDTFGRTGQKHLRPIYVVLFAGGDDDSCSLIRSLLRDRKTNSGRPSQNDESLIGKIHNPLSFAAKRPPLKSRSLVSGLGPHLVFHVLLRTSGFASLHTSAIS
jgi:hypothetical protein